MVSHRVPVPGAAPVASGLVTAVRPAISARGGLWLGWSGRLVPATQRRLSLQRADGIEHALLDLTLQEHEHHYAGFCNQLLWPLLHGLTELQRRHTGDWETYLAVNRLFARRLVPLLRRSDHVWIHDYHLIPLAAELRALGVAHRIGFFLHTPFPPPGVWQGLPMAAELLQSLLACDLVGVQTRLDEKHLRNSASAAGVPHPNTGVFPASIATAQVARSAVAGASLDHPLWPGHQQSCGHLILGADRLDPTKGVLQRLTGYDALLERHPCHRGQVNLLQILPDSRASVPHYLALRARVQAQAAMLNARYGCTGWVPMHLQLQSVDAPALARLYRAARVALVTPLRDGMNLVAKEYVAAQSAHDPGVLVLSHHAGAAQELDGALLVEPDDAQDIAGALHRALVMPLAERQARWQGMYRHLLVCDAKAWATGFLGALDAASRTNPGWMNRYDEAFITSS